MFASRPVGRVAGTAVAVASVLLAACGGGGGGDQSNAPSANLSDAQKNFESVALAANGGAHAVNGELSLTTGPTGTPTVSPSSIFYTTDSVVPNSPSAGSQTFALSYTSLSKTLSVPRFASGRYVVNGSILEIVPPGKVRISYSGANVQYDFLASDGTTVAYSLLGTAYTPVSLAGQISASPSELFSNSGLSLITNTINGTSLYNKQAAWQSGAAYLKVTRQLLADSLSTGDCIAPATSGTNPTPCSATINQLESFFPYAYGPDGTNYTLAQGQITTVAGVRAWIATNPLPGAPNRYRVFYQLNNAIYQGLYEKAGTITSVSGAAGAPQNFEVFLNQAAAQSVAAALTF